MAPPEKPWEIDLTVYQDEQELLAGLRRGEELACTCFMKWYAPSMTRLALRMVGDPDEAEGVVQESFIAACAKIDGFRGESALRTWLHRIVVNTALMRLRRRRPERLRIDPANEDARLPLLLANNPEEPLKAVLDRELGDELSQAIMQLPETLRTAFVLRELEGLSTREAAEALGISEAALKVRLHRARAALRGELGQAASP